MPSEKLLVIIEDCFHLPRLGVVILPTPSPDDVGSDKHGHVVRVRLVRPDGGAEEAEVTFYWAHYQMQHDPMGFRWECWLRRGNKEQVPLGTQMWLLEE
jgi:hypothetical protein